VLGTVLLKWNDGFVPSAERVELSPYFHALLAVVVGEERGFWI
jgi:hypothetical protein